MILIVRNVSNAARRCCVGDAYKLLTKCGFLMRKFSLCSYQLTLRMIDCMLQCHTRWTSHQRSQAPQWKRDAIGCSIQDRQDGSTFHRQRNQGRWTLLPWQSVAELSSARYPWEIQRRLCVSARWCSVAPCKVDNRVSAAERSQLYRAFCLASKQSRFEPYWLCCLGRPAASCVQSSDCGFVWSEGQSVQLLGQPRPTTHQQSRCSVATVIKSSGSSSRTAHWTVVYLTVWLLYTAVVFCHCDIILFGCFDSVVILNNLLTY